MLILGTFFAGLLLYGVFSRVLETRGITPQIAALALGLGLGLVAAGTSEVGVDIQLLHTFGEAALILCLFVDAARIDVRALRGTAVLPVRLLAVGLPLTIVAGTVAALLLVPGLTTLDAVLLGALVAPTDAALGALVVTSPRLPLRIRQALNVESGLNDGLVTPIVLVVAAAIAAEDGSGTTPWIVDAVRAIGLGSIAGGIVGVLGALLLQTAARRGWMLPGAHWMTGPAMAALAWFGAEVLGGNAFIAAFVAGLAATATVRRVPEDVLAFGEVAGELLGMAVFFLFGVLAVGLGPFEPGVLLFAILALTALRMLPVALALLGTGLAPSTVAFVGWFGPRGLATVVLAIVAAEFESAAGPVLAPGVLAAVVATVVLSVLAHGLSAGPAVAAYERVVRALPPGAPEHEATSAVRTRSRFLRAPVAVHGDGDARGEA